MPENFKSTPIQQRTWSEFEDDESLEETINWNSSFILEFTLTQHWTPHQLVLRSSLNERESNEGLRLYACINAGVTGLGPTY